MEAELDIRQAKEEALAYASMPWYERLKAHWKPCLCALISLIVVVVAFLAFTNQARASLVKWYVYASSLDYLTGNYELYYYYDADTDTLYESDGETVVASAGSGMSYLVNLEEEDGKSVSTNVVTATETEWFEDLAADAFDNKQYLSFFSLLILGSLSNICESGLDLINDSMNYLLANMSDTAMGYLTGSIGGSTYTVKDVDADGSYSTSSYSTALLDSVGETIYSFIETIANDIVEPAAIALLSLVLLFSLLKIASRFDAGGGTMPAVREVLVLCVCAGFYIWFVSNAFDVMSLVFSFFQELLADAMGGTIDTGSISLSIDYTLEESDVTSDGSYLLSTIWWYVLVYIVSLFIAGWIFLAVIKFGVKLVCVSLIRGVQIYMLLAFSPLPFTFIGLDETRQWGIGYIRHFAMISLQGLAIYIVAYIFPILVTSISAYSMSLASGITELILWAVVTRGLIEAATSLLERTGDLASSVFGG